MSTESGCDNGSVTLWTCFERAPTNSEILNMPPRQAAYKRLSAASVDGVELLNRVRVVALLRRIAKYRKGNWTEGTGKSEKTIKDVPRRIANMADEITPLITHPLIGPIFQTDEHVSKLYSALPDILRAFSRRLEHQVSTVPPVVAQLNKGRGLSPKLCAHLCEWVGKETGGRFLYDDLAELLTATYEADQQSVEAIGADNIKNLHERERAAGWPKPRIVDVRLNLQGGWIQLTVEP